MRRGFRSYLAAGLALVLLLSAMPFAALAEVDPFTEEAYPLPEDDSAYTVLYENEPVAVTLENAGDYAWFSFVPSRNMNYIFCSTGGADTLVRYYNYEEKHIGLFDDGGEAGNFRINRYLTSGKRYLFGVTRTDKADTGTFNVVIDRVRDGECGENVNWHVNEDCSVLTISGNGAMRNYSKTSLAPWNDYWTTIKAVEIQDGVTYVGNYAFNELSRVVRVTLADSVESIGNYAFLRCTSLSKVEYAGGLSAWQRLDIADGNGWLTAAAGYDETIGAGEFGEGFSWELTRDRVLRIHGSGEMPDFSNRSGYFSGSVYGSTSEWDQYQELINELVIDEGVTRIGNYAFTQLTEASKATIPESVTAIGDYAFYGAGLRTIELPKNLASVGDCGLSDMERLMELNLPEGLTTVGTAAFARLHIRSVSIPVSLTSIPKGAFYTCQSLTYVFYGGDADQWAKIDIDSNNEPLQRTILYYADGASVEDHGDCGADASWTLDQDGVLTIRGSGAMADYKTAKRSDLNVNYRDSNGYSINEVSTAPWGSFVWKIKEIVVSEGITHVGAYAFYNCFNAKSVKLPDTLKSVGTSAFRSSNIGSVRLPDSVETLGVAAFYGCVSLTDARLSENITALPADCFSRCSRLTELKLPERLETLAASGLSSGANEITIPASVRTVSGSFSQSSLRFLGPIPDGLSQSQLDQSDIFVQPEYYEAYKRYLLPYMLNRYLDDSGVLRYHSLTSGDKWLNLSSCIITMDEKRLGAKLRAYVDGVDSGLEVTWTSNDRRIGIQQDGTIVPLGGTCTAFVYAEARWQGYTALTFCEVKLVNSHNSEMIVDMLPTAGIEPNAIAVVSTTSRFADGSVDYQTAQFIETDTSNSYYQELLALTRSLTADCETDREKTSKIFAWVRANTTWQAPPFCGGTTPDQAYAVYESKVGNCAGFSKLAGFMLSLAGIPSAIAQSVDHMWNIVLLDGKWVMLDAQYGANAFAADYSSDPLYVIKYLTMAQGDFTYVVDTPGEIKLGGVGMNATEQARRDLQIDGIADFVDTISASAFQGCTNLDELTIPSNVTKIEDRAFWGCKALQSLTIPDSVESIGDRVFYNCPNVVIRCNKFSAAQIYAISNNISYELLDGPENVLTLPADCSAIESQAFAGLANVDRINIPASVQSIAPDAFEGTDALLAVPAGSYAESWAEENGVRYAVV